MYITTDWTTCRTGTALSKRPLSTGAAPTDLLTRHTVQYHMVYVGITFLSFINKNFDNSPPQWVPD